MQLSANGHGIFHKETPRFCFQFRRSPSSSEANKVVPNGISPEKSPHSRNDTSSTAPENVKPADSTQDTPKAKAQAPQNGAKNDVAAAMQDVNSSNEASGDAMAMIDDLDPKVPSQNGVDGATSTDNGVKSTDNGVKSTDNGVKSTDNDAIVDAATKSSKMEIVETPDEKKADAGTLHAHVCACMYVRARVCVYVRVCVFASAHACVYVCVLLLFPFVCV